MQHCISRYAKNAIQGSVYLFHVEKDGEEASVRVTYNGEIPQAYGPRNCQNKASKWGSRVLRRWGISSRYLGSAGKPNFCNASSWVIMSRQYNK